MEPRSEVGESTESLLKVVEQFREAYQSRDIERVMALFAADAELSWAAGTFRGEDAIRKVFEWDIRLSPTATVRYAGIGVIATDHTAVAERVVSLTAEGIPHDEHALTVFEFDDASRIRSLRSYYDKLAIMHQIASGYPGIRGRVFRAMTGYLMRLGSKGLEVSPT